MVHPDVVEKKTNLKTPISKDHDSRIVPFWLLPSTLAAATRILCDVPPNAKAPPKKKTVSIWFFSPAAEYGRSLPCKLSTDNKSESYHLFQFGLCHDMPCLEDSTISSETLYILTLLSRRLNYTTKYMSIESDEASILRPRVPCEHWWS
jgi:hypothetical protein